MTIAAAGALRVGVISDTHGLLREQALHALRSSDHIVHGGDIGTAQILEALRAIAPVTAVRGNNDRASWADAIPEVVETVLAGTRILVIHDLSALAHDPADRGIAVVISGHSHRPSVTQRNGVLYLNPGSAGPRRFTLPVVVATLHLAPHRPPRAELIELAA
jgi:putative phosphoesterase